MAGILKNNNVKYERMLHMSSCPVCKEDSLNVFLYRRVETSEKFRCIECIWGVDPEADLENTIKESHV